MTQLDDSTRIERPDESANGKESTYEGTPEVAMLLQGAPASIRSSLINGASGVTSNLQNRGAEQPPAPTETDIIMLLDLMPQGQHEMTQ